MPHQSVTSLSLSNYSHQWSCSMRKSQVVVTGGYIHTTLAMLPTSFLRTCLKSTHSLITFHTYCELPRLELNDSARCFAKFQTHPERLWCVGVSFICLYQLGEHWGLFYGRNDSKSLTEWYFLE